MPGGPANEVAELSRVLDEHCAAIGRDPDEIRRTVQSRLPDPGWLERWLDEQIRFDKEWETKVVERILHNLSLLFERTFTTVQDLNRYRKEISARLTTGGPAPQTA